MTSKMCIVLRTCPPLPQQSSQNFCIFRVAKNYCTLIWCPPLLAPGGICPLTPSLSDATDHCLVLANQQKQNNSPLYNSKPYNRSNLPPPQVHTCCLLAAFQGRLSQLVIPLNWTGCWRKLLVVRCPFNQCFIHIIGSQHHQYIISPPRTPDGTDVTNYVDLQTCLLYTSPSPRD